MAENIPPASLPPPPSILGAPGYDGPPGTNGHGNTHMPPPSLPPVIIPQNNAPLPTAILTPGGAVTPGSGGGLVTRAAPEPNKRALYVGGLDVRVTEDVLKQIFETTGHVVSVKIVPDKNASSKGLNYGFVEYDDPASAHRAMETLNGRRVHLSEIRVNWAYLSNTVNKEDTSNHYHIFVGDLSNEVNDEVLLQAFSAFGVVSEARVMWDMKTGRSRGYGFVAFKDRPDAERALSKMDGEWLGSRAIRCNWANQKGQPSISQQQAMQAMGMTPTTPWGHHHFPTQGVQSYEMVVNQTQSWQTTCYVGNLTPYTTQNELIPLFSNYGYVLETRLQSDRGFAFIKMDSHENAAMAICQLSGYNLHGRPIKCSWGKDRPPTTNFEQYSPQTSFNSASASTPSGYNPSSPYFAQYSAGSQYSTGNSLTPQGLVSQAAIPSPGGRVGWDTGHQQVYGSQNMQQQSYGQQQGYGQQTNYGQLPISTGGYGRGQTSPGSGLYPPQQLPPQSYGATYAGYQG